jgi:arsenate reductase-like glutaredoxin family protein
MQKIVDLFMVPDDPDCVEVQEFLQQQDLRVQIHDIEKKPLTAKEIANLIRHLDLKHFLNASSKTYSRKKLDKSLPSREEVIALMAEDNDLLRKPIIVAGRLMVVGPNRSKIVQMLQLRGNGSDPMERQTSVKAAKGSQIRN